MSKNYTGPLAGLRRWNSRRLEKRRWQRALLEALAEDDAAIMAALSRLLEREGPGNAARPARQAEMERRLETLEEVAADLGAHLAARFSELGGRIETSMADLSARLEGRLAEPVRQLAVLNAKLADGFPLIATAREGLLEPELEVLSHLASGLAPKVALDVGAHHGRFTRVLLDLGFEVHALEPNPAARTELRRRLDGRPGLTVHAAAAGAEDGEASLRLVADPSGRYSDATQFASLAGLPLPAGLVEAGSVRVPVRRLDMLVKACGIAAPSVVKIDAEGYDLEVLRGLGDLRPAVLVVEFWDEALPFSAPGARNRLPDLVTHARAHGAPWHLVVFRRWGDDRPAFYAGWMNSPEQSWGNALFFTDRALFERARDHLSTILPEARFVAAPGP